MHPTETRFFLKADRDAHIEYVTEIIILTCVVWCFFSANLNHHRIFNAALDEQVCWVNMIKNCSMYWTKSNSWCQTIYLFTQIYMSSTRASINLLVPNNHQYNKIPVNLVHRGGVFDIQLPVVPEATPFLPLWGMPGKRCRWSAGMT